MRYKDVFLIILMLCFFAEKSFSASQPTATSTMPYPFYEGMRQMGMGGAAVAVVDDETALILNPAALGKLRTSYLTIANPEVHANSMAAKTLNADNYDFSKTTDPQTLLNTLTNYPDKHFSESASVFPSYVVPNFGVGLLGTYNYDAQIDSTNNLFDIRFRNDFAAIIGYDFRFFDGIIKLGFNAKYISRAEVDTTKPTNSVGMSWGNLVNSGSGIGSDVGLILTGPWEYLPTIAAVWRDVGDTSYNHSGLVYSGQTPPARTEQSLAVGASISPILGNHERMQITAEVTDLLFFSKVAHKISLIHAGAEFNVYDRLFVRGGLNEGYWTAGLELTGLEMQLQVATWGEEIGTATKRMEDRRYGAEFAFRF